MIVQDERGKAYNLDKQMDCIKLAKYIEDVLIYLDELYKNPEVYHCVSLKVVSA